jgi:hypothetical protein
MAGETTAEPLFVLAPGRSFTSIVTAMLGQHPQMYGFPELNLNLADTLGEWWQKLADRRFTRVHTTGLLRSVAQLYFGAQTEETIGEATQWIQQRLSWSTADVLRALMERIAPRIPVEKSPLLATQPAAMQRLLRSFPNAHFIHLVRHPRSTCKSLLNPEIAGGQLNLSARCRDYSTNPPTVDPQMLWYDAHREITAFMDRVPTAQRMLVLGEEFLSQPEAYLRDIAGWLGLRTDPAAIDEMMHPERSPYAHFGPRSAALGNDPGFLQRPEFRPFRRTAESLDEALPWRPDGCGFLLEVRALAREFGYP